MRKITLSDIRVTYSGLISFFIRLLSVFTGMIFTLIVTRELTQEEFGTWGLIGGLIIYVTIIEPVISYWTTREIARGTESGRTALFSSSVFSVVGIGGYLIIAFVVGNQTDVEQHVLVLASILIPVLFLNYTLNAVNLGWKPQAVSYGFLAFELTKIPMALILIYFLHLGIEGAILASFFSHITSIITLMIFARKKLKSGFDKNILKKWFKLSWLPLYRNIFPIVAASDLVIFSVVTGSVYGIAYIISSRAISNLVSHTQSFSQALYPKLLKGGRREYLQENITRLFYFAIPLFGISIVFAKPGLFLLNPIYEVAVLIVIFLSIRAFLSTLNKTLYSSVQGIDEVDVGEKSTLKEYVKSKLFLVPTIRIIQYGTYSILLIIGLTILMNNGSSQLDLAIFWSIIAVVTEIPFTIHSIILVRKEFPLKVDYKSITKYLLSSILILIPIFILIEEFLIYDENVFIFIPNLFLYVFLVFISYLGITYLIDKRTKTLVKAVINEIRGK